jgi:hypothetical protein
VWVSPPQERGTDKEGKEIWKPTIQITEAGMKHLQNAVRGQLRALLEDNTADERVQDAAATMGGKVDKPRFGGSAFGDAGYQESRRAAQQGQDIPF